MPNPTHTTDPTETPAPTPTQFDRAALFHDHGPFHPSFQREAIRALLRTLPIDPAEPKGWADRRMFAALLALSALHPRDEIEVMLGIQAVAAYHAAAAGFHLGMNLATPKGTGTRHITAACSAARTFDALLRALERRQAKPLAVPIGRPAPQAVGRPAPLGGDRRARRPRPRRRRPAQKPKTSRLPPPSGAPKTSPSPSGSANRNGSNRTTRASTSPTPRASCHAAA